MCSVSQSWPTFCNPRDCSPPGSSVHGIFPGKNTGVDCHSFLQGIFPIQELNLAVLHSRQILYCLSHQRSPLNIHIGSFKKKKKRIFTLISHHTHKPKHNFNIKKISVFYLKNSIFKSENYIFICLFVFTI